MLTVFLLVSNLGLAINVHYCADEIASITINVAPDSGKVVDECCGIVEEEPGCCNDKIIKAEIKSDQIIVKSLSFDPALHSVIYDWKPKVLFQKITSNKKIIVLTIAMRMHRHCISCTANIPFTPDLN